MANKTSPLSSSGQQRRLSLQLQPELKSKPTSRPRSPTGGQRRKAADKQLSVGTRDRLLYFPLGAQSSTTSLLRLSSSEQKTNASKKGGHVNFSQLARMLGAGLNLQLICSTNTSLRSRSTSAFAATCLRSNLLRLHMTRDGR